MEKKSFFLNFNIILNTCTSIHCTLLQNAYGVTDQQLSMGQIINNFKNLKHYIYIFEYRQYHYTATVLIYDLFLFTQALMRQTNIYIQK